MFLQANISCFQSDFCTRTGEIKTVALSDGSTVTLSSQTAINVAYNEHLRQVRLLRGEAYFEVQPNPDHPFIVEGNYSRTKVVGTRFIVREDNNFDTVTVNQGIVEVGRNNIKPYVLRVNDQLSIGEANSNGLRHVSAATEGAWTKGHLVFENACLDVVINEIERYSKGVIVIKNSRLKSVKVSGRFDISTPNKALEALEQTLPIKLYRLTPWLTVIA
ncbi:MAG: FecR domain-containing protein [Methylococcaceae bacterium]|nr:FecR domain-containing protein [Methylococcaceae bacterium]